MTGRKRCLREASLKRGFAILPATSLALLCIEISESTPSRNFPPKRNSPSRGIRTAAEIFIRSVRPREFRVMARLRSVAKSRRRAACENCMAEISRINARTVIKSSSETSSSTALIKMSVRAAEYIARRPASDDARSTNDQWEKSLLNSLDSKGLLFTETGSLKEFENATVSGARRFGPKN